MNNVIYIEDDNISEIDLYVGNKEVHLLRYYEPEPGIFIAESKNVINIALNQGYEPLSIMCTEKLLDDEIIARVGDIPIYVVDPVHIKEYLGYYLSAGIFAAMRRKNKSDIEKILKNSQRVVVLEDVENPTNMGAIFRSAAALGIDAVLLSPACVDPLYRRAMRVSVGNTILLPWSYICTHEKDWKEKGIAVLKEYGFTTVAMALREDNISMDDPLLKNESKLALIMGNEGNGLAASTIMACDYVAKIPMARGVDSLNVAVAAGIAMWEIRKTL